MSPATAYYPNSYSIAAPIQVRQTIPHGTGATTARLTAVIDFAINGGHEVVTRTGSISLPFCAKSVKASVSFAMKCDRSVDVTINYPATAEASTTAAVVGTSLSGAQWESGPITLRAGGEVRKLLVPSPYTTDIVVTQKDAVATMENGVIGRSGSLAQPTACAVSTGGAPVLPPPVGGGGGGTSGGGSAGGGSDPGAAPPSGSEPSGPTPTGSGAAGAARAGRAGGPELAEPAAPDLLGFPVTAAVGGLLAGFGTAVAVGGVTAAVLFIRRRRRPSP